MTAISRTTRRAATLMALPASARIIVFLVFSAFGLAGTAHAQSCTVTAASGAFGSVNVLPGTAINSSTTFSVSCSGTANKSVRLCMEMGRGSSAAGPNSERALSNGALYADFEFYSDSARTQLWGSWGAVVTAYGTAGVSFDLPLGSGGSASQTFTAYTAILAGQATTQPATYNWAGSSPGVSYGYVAASACPTGGSTATSSGSAWSAVIAATCNISATTLNFGSTSPVISANIDSTATVTAQCTNTTPYSIGLDNGTHVTGSQRRMQLGVTSNYLNYNLYTDSARSKAWTTSTGTTSCTGGTSTCVLGTGTASNQNVTAYGRVPPQTSPAAGTFTDTVVVTATF